MVIYKTSHMPVIAGTSTTILTVGKKYFQACRTQNVLKAF